MLRKVAMVLAPLLLCMPVWGGLQLPLDARLQGLLTPHSPASWWLTPYQLAIASACLMVLALTVCMRYQQPARQTAR